MPYYSRRYQEEPGRKWILLYMFIPVLIVVCFLKKINLIVEKNYIHKCSLVCSTLDENQKKCCVSVCLNTFYKKQ